MVHLGLDYDEAFARTAEHRDCLTQWIGAD
jgi:hypothetical protein